MESTVEPPSAQVPLEEKPTMSASAALPTTPALDKKVGALVLDSGGLIKNEIAISTLISQTEELYTIPAVIQELKDEATRARIQPLMPFLKLRNPRPDSSKFISDFARKTGDLSVLSRVDLQLLALTYELEKERNKGDWRLRNDPSQKTVNGKPPGAEGKEDASPATEPTTETAPTPQQPEDSAAPQAEEISGPVLSEDPLPEAGNSGPEEVQQNDEVDTTAAQVQELSLGVAADMTSEEVSKEASQPEDEPSTPNDDEIEDDGEGEWITPSNLDKHRKKDNGLGAPQPIEKMLQVAILTTDNAMRNVALRINLNLLDPSFARVTYIKTWVLRCHTCMKICKEQRQFCPSCGHPTLTRVSVSTDANNNVTVHLKKNFQWNNRGNVYSIPKPTHGTASGKASNVKGGGKGGWGQELILAEDQKEYTRKADEQRRTRYRDVMDEDYLPSILTGDRRGGQSKIKVGAGRNVNSKKR
ncbi:D-site 20S pre-rRNA nuclease [Thozetella sp. PMI_491]|nr:D-site 20S pre-rRNA nuclease [Thozetella sp. PMI_491]